MEKNIVCVKCGNLLVSYSKDKRMGYCEQCKVERCGWCGGSIMIGYTYYRADSIWDWLIPKKILESLFYSPWAHCWKCDRTYHLKRTVIKYIFWEAKVLWWKTRKFFQEKVKGAKSSPLATNCQ